ncbi:MAG: S8 family serine peptidase [Candidatus Hodarchaeales archaeon]|jgi:subtilisin family serine protease
MKLKIESNPSPRGFIIVFVILFTFLISSSNSLAISYYWNIEEVGIPEAWQYTKGSPEIIVAVIDSGIDFSHPDLVNSSWINQGERPNNGWDDDNNGYIDDIVGWDFREGDYNPSPPLPPSEGSKHGTFIAGLIAAANDNDLFVGIAPNVRIMDLRFLTSDLQFYANDWPKLVRAIDYAIDNGAHIINLSLQANGIPPEEVYNAIKRAYDANISIVGVTGNSENFVTFPGNYSEVIAVSATDNLRNIAEFSAYGFQNEICAPGQEVYSITGYKTTIVTGNGTSFAAPLVSGAIALMLSLNSSLTVAEIREILHTTCIDLGTEGKDPFYGYGLLNIPAALSKVSPSITITNTTSTTANDFLDIGILFLGSFSMFLLLIISVVLFRVKKSNLL